MGSDGANRRLMIIGGGGDQEGGMAILREFVGMAGGPDKGWVLVMSAASTDHRAQDEKDRAAFGRLGVAIFRSLETATRQDADAAKSVGVVDWATGIFFTGGDQKRIIRLLEGTKLHRELHRRLAEGVVIAGTSAGASRMSATMLDEGESDECPRVGVVEPGEGMGMLPGVIVDQHFGRRGRLGRLLAASAERPEELGIGLGEDTAMVVEWGRFRVLGRGGATVIDASRLSYNDLDHRGDGARARDRSSRRPIAAGSQPAGSARGASSSSATGRPAA